MKLSYLLLSTWTFLIFAVLQTRAAPFCEAVFSDIPFREARKHIIGHLDLGEESALPTPRLQRLGFLARKLNTLEAHQNFANEGADFLKSRGIESEVHCSKSHCQIVIKPGRKTWLQKFAKDARSNKKQVFLVVFDTSHYLHLGGAVLEYSNAAFKLPTDLPFVSLSWANLAKSEPTPAAIHEMDHYFEVIVDFQRVHIRIVEHQTDDFVQAVNPLYFGQSGHSSGEFRAYSRQARASYADGMAKIKEAQILVEKNTSYEVSAEAVSKALLSLQSASIALNQVMLFTHRDPVRLSEIEKGIEGVKLDVVPKGLRGIYDRAYSYKENNSENGVTIFISSQSINRDTKVDESLDKSKLIEQMRALRLEMRHARSQAEVLEREIKNAKDLALQVLAKEAEKLSADSLAKMIRETIEAVKEVSPFFAESGSYKILNLTYAKIETLGGIYLRKLGVEVEKVPSSYGVTFRHDWKVKPNASPEAHWMSRLAAVMLARSKTALHLNGSHITGSFKSYSYYAIFPWEAILSSSVPNSVLAENLKTKIEKVNDTVERVGMGVFASGLQGPLAGPSVFGRFLPKLEFTITTGKFEESKHSTVTLAVKRFEASLELRDAKALRRQLTDQNRSEIQPLLARKAQLAAEIAKTTLDQVQTDIQTIDMAIERLLGQKRQESKPRLVLEDVVESDLDVAQRRIEEDILDALDLVQGTKRSRPLISKGYSWNRLITMDPKNWVISYHSGMVEAFHEKLPVEWAGVDYAYIKNEKESDWSLQPAAVAEFLTMTRSFLEKLEGSLVKIHRDALEVSRNASPRARLQRIQ